MLYGVYCLGTSLDNQEYPTDRVFCLFKEQYVVENANKILKGPVKLRPIFLHHQTRIESLILSLCLNALLSYRKSILLSSEEKGRENSKETKENNHQRASLEVQYLCPCYCLQLNIKYWSF